MIKVAINGAAGRMGRTIVGAVDGADDMEVVACIDIKPDDGTFPAPYYTDLATALASEDVEVVIDFTHPTVVASNIRTALAAGVATVVGTTGLSEETLEELSAEAPEVPLFVAPNFTTGAVLMMAFSKIAAKYFPDVDIIELHHDGKADAPSGTAIRTANLMAANRAEESMAPGAETELAGYEGARGANVSGVPVHSVRTAGHVASQEVIFGSLGQTLTIRHDSIDRTSYMPGILLAVREVQKRPGLTVGLEKLMGL